MTERVGDADTRPLIALLWCGDEVEARPDDTEGTLLHCPLHKVASPIRHVPYPSRGDADTRQDPPTALEAIGWQFNEAVSMLREAARSPGLSVRLAEDINDGLPAMQAALEVAVALATNEALTSAVDALSEETPRQKRIAELRNRPVPARLFTARNYDDSLLHTRYDMLSVRYALVRPEDLQWLCDLADAVPSVRYEPAPREQIGWIDSADPDDDRSFWWSKPNESVDAMLDQGYLPVFVESPKEQK